MKPSNPLVVAYGGGVNSTAMLVEMYHRGIKPDLILFADTGGERPETYQSVKLVSDWCLNHGFPNIETVWCIRDGNQYTLEEHSLRYNQLPSIAYGYKSCSVKFKADPQHDWLKKSQLFQDAISRGFKICKAIGYDAGETQRAKIADDEFYSYWYPLIEWDIYREDCVEICRSEGLPTEKSSCFFCPSMKRWEIVDLAKKHPELMARALKMESNASLTSIAGLGRNFSWRDFLANEANQQSLWPDHDVPEIPCGCYDG